MPDPWGPADGHRLAVPAIRHFGEECYGQDSPFSVRLTSGCRRIRQSEAIGKSVDAEADTYYNWSAKDPHRAPGQTAQHWEMVDGDAF